MIKTGLVVEGGGMRGIYGCGVLDSFLKNGIDFDYGIGVSAGAANLASFLAGQERRNYRFYTQYAFDKRYMGVSTFFKTGSFFGMNFIYDELTNVIDPVDYDAFLDPKHEFYIVATDAETARPKYFARTDFKDKSGNIMKASCAVPAMCEPVEIEDKLYFDGGVTDPVPVRRAIEDGCDKLVVVLTRQRGYIKKQESGKPVYTELLKKYPKIKKSLDARHILYNNTMKYLYSLEKEGKAMLFCPETTMGVNIITRNRTSLDALYNLGKKEADEKKDEIIKFLAK